MQISSSLANLRKTAGPDEKKDLAIVLGLTGNISFSAANVLLGIKKHLKQSHFDVIIFFQDMKKEDMELLNSILPCSFIEYKFPIENSAAYDKLKSQKYTLVAFSRYECFNLLDLYQKVLWLDTDILINGDFSPLLRQSTLGIGLYLQKGSVLAHNFINTIEGFDFSREFYNTGVLLLSEELPHYRKIADLCYEKTYELADILVMPDQGILNLIIQELNIKVDNLSERYNTHPRKYCYVNNPAIIHAYGRKKFWSHYYFRKWNRNYTDWLKMGGCPYNGNQLSKIKRVLNMVSLIMPPPLRRPKLFFRELLKK